MFKDYNLSNIEDILMYDHHILEGYCDYETMDAYPEIITPWSYIPPVDFTLPEIKLELQQPISKYLHRLKQKFVASKDNCGCTGRDLLFLGHRCGFFKN